MVGWWEPILFAVFTGLAFYFAQASSRPPALSSIFRDKVGRLGWLPFGVLGCVSSLCGLWWYLQSCELFNSFQFGFNDFGHFLLRVVRTARGQGFLLETPVLPTYWDHFNPGLALIVPLWSIVPRVELVFALQAIALAGSALVVYMIAVKHRHSVMCSACWALAWLFYPSIGQMNVAYTYGWHPITLAIPALLGSYLFVQYGRYLTALALAILAASFEEGAIAAIGCFAAVGFIKGLANRYAASDPLSGCDESEAAKLSPRVWLVVWIVALLAFLAIYRWSGLATFQTGRFAKLGRNAIEIALSPILVPGVFAELLFRQRNLAFLLFLLTPFVVLLSRRSFYWTMLSVAPLFLVLLLWEHLPAQSLAFQYPSVILPILFIGAIECTPTRISTKVAVSVLSIGWILSIYVGQFPWSGDTLIDVKSRAYGPDPNRTQALSEDSYAKYRDQIGKIRRGENPASLPFAECRILSTGRLAAHFLGAEDLETVGQFWQRRSEYAKLQPELPSPLLRYNLIVLDLKEGFQQTQDETQRVFEEAVALGYKPSVRPYGFMVLTRKPSE
jgi:uncharacterized membrane protein